MKVFITGGTGFVGSALTSAFLGSGHEVTVLTRKTRTLGPFRERVSFMEGDPARKGEWQERVAGHDVIVNLAGASIFQRWTKERKRAIRESRLLTTENLVEALSGAKGGRIRLLSTSAVGFYGFHGDEILDEGSPPGEGFLASLSREWEAAAAGAESLGIEVSILRFGVVLGRHGGALKQMVPLVRYYLGSPLGSGKQWFSWIHLADLVSIYLFLLSHPALSGPVNCTAPHPVRNEELMRAMTEEMRRPLLPSVPEFVLKMILGEFASALVKGQRVLPRRLLEEGYSFRYPEIRDALSDLLGSGGRIKSR